MKQLIGLTLILLVAFSNTAIAARDSVQLTGKCHRKGNCRDIGAKLAPVNVPECIKTLTCRDTTDHA